MFEAARHSRITLGTPPEVAAQIDEFQLKKKKGDAACAECADFLIKNAMSPTMGIP
jgi:hypothetical protein